MFFFPYCPSEVWTIGINHFKSGRKQNLYDRCILQGVHPSPLCLRSFVQLFSNSTFKTKQNTPKQTLKTKKTPVCYITSIFHFIRREPLFTASPMPRAMSSTQEMLHKYLLNQSINKHQHKILVSQQKHH